MWGLGEGELSPQEPSLLLRLPAHPHRPAQPGRGLRWGRLPGSGEAIGGA